jgi:hypothetical protein
VDKINKNITFYDIYITNKEVSPHECG